MTEKIEGKNGNQWQFISDENDIETIMKKLDLIIEQNKWKAHRLMKLTLSVGEGMNGTEVDEYTKLFISSQN